MMLPQSFYNRNTLQVAQDLLGCFLVRRIGRKVIRAKIVETEAYNGPADLASHASRGKTERNKVMFGEPGIIYVYFTYGMHYMLNIVTEAKNYPAAVLIRAVELHRSRAAGQTRKKMITNGPAKLTKVLKIDKSFNGLPIYTKKHSLWIESRAGDEKPPIVKVKRIGINYAGKYKDKKWRFYIKDNKFVSKK
jgi:DNA-3-methyladenine glycosylase